MTEEIKEPTVTTEETNKEEKTKAPRKDNKKFSNNRRPRKTFEKPKSDLEDNIEKQIVIAAGGGICDNPQLRQSLPVYLHQQTDAYRATDTKTCR